MRAALLSSLVLVACQRSSIVPIFPDAGPDDLVIAVVENERGGIDQLEWFLAKEDAPVLLRDPTDRLHFFAIAEGDLISPSGETFATGLVGSLRIYDASEKDERRGCGRCLGTTASPPQVLREGDECEPPLFAAYEGEDRAAIASRIRIGFGEGCSCEPFRPIARNAPPSVELLDDREEAWPYEAIATTASGAIALFGEHRSLVIARSGERLSRSGAEMSIRGRVVSAAASREGTFFTVDFEGNERKIHVFDDRLTLLAELDLRVVANSVVALREGGVLVLAEQPGEEPVAIRCPGAPPFTCDAIWSATFGAIGRTLTDAVRMKDGTTVFAGLEGLALLDHLPSDGAEVVASRTIRPDIPELDESVSHYFSVGRAGEFLVVCLQSPEGGVLAAARVDRSTITSSATPAFRTLHRGSRCGRFAAIPEEPDAVRMVFVYGDHVVIDGSGPTPIARDASRSYAPTGAEAPVHGMRTFEDGATIAWTGLDGRNAVWIRDGGTHRLVYGHPDASWQQIVELVTAPDRVIALRADGGGVAIRPDRTEPIRIEGVAGFVSRAAYDGAADDLLLAGSDGTRAWIAHAPLEGGGLRAMRQLAEIEQVHRVVEMSPGVFLLVSSSDELFVLRQDRIDPIEPSWDDPSTAEIEVEPSCGQRLRDASAIDGRAYVVGCGPTLLEVDASPPRAQRIGGSRLRVEAASELPIPTAVAAICPDHAIFGARGVVGPDLERGRTWELAPPADCDAPYLGRCVREIDQVGEMGRYASGLPAAIAQREGTAIAVFHSGAHGGGSAHAVGSGGRYRFPEALTLVAAAPWGAFLIATGFGQILVWR